MKTKGSPLQQEVVDGQGDAQQQDQRQTSQRHSASPASQHQYTGLQHFQGRGGVRTGTASSGEHEKWFGVRQHVNVREYRRLVEVTVESVGDPATVTPMTRMTVAPA